MCKGNTPHDQLACFRQGTDANAESVAKLCYSSEASSSTMRAARRALTSASTETHPPLDCAVLARGEVTEHRQRPVAKRRGEGDATAVRDLVAAEAKGAERRQHALHGLGKQRGQAAVAKGMWRAVANTVVVVAVNATWMTVTRKLLSR